MNIGLILNKLEKTKSTGTDKWQARCPAHHDKNPSLTITKENDRILLYCHAGCSTEEIVSALGLRMKDLFKDNGQYREKKSKEIVSSYDYHNEQGETVFRVVRFDDKTFAQRLPDGTWGLGRGRDKVNPVPYRLPKIIEAAEKEEIVYIVEGEKDVRTLEKLGLTATTNPMGAGKWRDEYSEYLKGAEVIILPDNDEPGKDHAEKVAQSLKGKAKNIKVVELPGLGEGGDISNFINEGKTKNELIKIVENTPEYKEKKEKPKRTAKIVNLKDVEPEEVSWLWWPYIPRRKLTIMEGDPGDGKTWIALMVAAALSNGWPLPDQEGRMTKKAENEPGTVLYLSAEDGIADTLRPRLDKLGADVSNIHMLTGWKDEEEGKEGEVTLKDLGIIAQAMERVKPSLIVIDPVQGYLGPGTDMNKAEQVRPLLAALSHLAEEYEAAALCLRHLTKANLGKSIYRGLGSIDFTAAARSVLMVGSNPDDPQEKVILQLKNSLEQRGTGLTYEIGAEGFFWTGITDLMAPDLNAIEQGREDKTALEEAEDFLKECLAEGPQEPKEVKKQAEQAGIAEKTLRRAREKVGVKAEKIDRFTWHWKLSAQHAGVGKLGNTVKTPDNANFNQLDQLDHDGQGQVEEGVIE